ncbi:LytR/AlgR family response regulator transcription factor [Gordonia rubripertincta]|uniref:LytTR family DNA-binding domain-containing protein n=1 Tax=Gordonia rubripertincta TaxID=36822 RepID=A0ABT4MRZ9_GORRU|nr:LytTR family DNA-binding domain-containing protein [Gordonia rubripertincta]MCZ4549768.1 LytTR family DNA-binding domain-containing protein [Gordonia rubripertincta]
MTQNSSPPNRHGPLTVLAVDDEAPALDELAYLLGREEAVGEVVTAADATTALRVIKDRPDTIDAVFLDINMPGLDGLELAGVLAAFANPPAVVFVTAHDDRAVRAFDLGAVDYLLKPLRAQRLSESVRRVVELREQRDVSATPPGPTAEADSDEVIAVEMGGATTLVQRSAVLWVEADGDYSRLHTETGSHLVRIPISTLENRWEKAGFLRVHRSYLVLLRLVTGIRTVGSGTVVCLGPGQDGAPVELPVSRRHTRELKDRLVRSSKQGR